MPDTRETGVKRPSVKTEPPRRPAAGEVLRARPVKGKTDRRSLTRAIIARFPKILAALAK